MKMLNGKNYFNEQSLQEMIAALEAGETIAIYIDCIGHTRAEREATAYIHALKEKYSAKLVIDKTSYHLPLLHLQQ